MQHTNGKYVKMKLKVIKGTLHVKCKFTFGPYEQIFDELEGFLSEEFYIRTLDIEIFCPHELLSLAVEDDIF